MKSPLTVRPATQADIPALACLDVSYPAGRVLALHRSGSPPEETISFRWREREARTVNAYELTEAGLRRALGRADLFLVAEVDGAPAGLLMVVVPPTGGAGEITDLAVDRRRRRRGAGRALVEAALAFGRSRGLRSMWVEPRSDNAEAIAFYVALGFRLSGFNDRMYSNGDHEEGRATLFMHRDLD